jgi:hypothetical protein
LNLAIRLKDYLKVCSPFFKVNSGVYSTSRKANIIKTLGVKIKNAKVIFQVSKIYESNDISDIPNEKAS